MLFPLSRFSVSDEYLLSKKLDVLRIRPLACNREKKQSLPLTSNQFTRRVKGPLEYKTMRQAERSMRT